MILLARYCTLQYHHMPTKELIVKSLFYSTISSHAHKRTDREKYTYIQTAYVQNVVCLFKTRLKLLIVRSQMLSQNCLHCTTRYCRYAITCLASSIHFFDCRITLFYKRITGSYEIITRLLVMFSTLILEGCAVAHLNVYCEYTQRHPVFIVAPHRYYRVE